MKRLLVFSHAGVLDVNRAVFQAMAREGGITVEMVVPQRWKGDLIRALEYRPSDGDAALRISALPVAVSGNGSLFFHAGRLRPIVVRFQPDLVFVDEEPWSINAVQIALSCRDRSLVVYTKQNLRKTIPAPFRAAERWFLSRTEKAYVCADEVGDVLREWKGYRKPVVRLPHSFDPALFKPLDPAERARRRRDWGLPEDAMVVGYYGRLAEEKGIQDLLEAMQLVLARSPREPYFLWVGSGPMAASVQSAVAASSGRARHRPAVPHHQAGEAMALSDIVVVPSRTRSNWKEQFGRIIPEALACGAMVVGSDSGEIPHLIRRTGGGVVFREGDVQALAHELARLAEAHGERRALASAGREYVMAELTHRAVANWLSLDLFESLSGQEGPA